MFQKRHITGNTKYHQPTTMQPRAKEKKAEPDSFNTTFNRIKKGNRYKNSKLITNFAARKIESKLINI